MQPQADRRGRTGPTATERADAAAPEAGEHGDVQARAAQGDQTARDRAGDQLPQHHGDDGHDDHHPRLLAQEHERVERRRSRSRTTFTMPKSMLTTEASQEGVPIIISKIADHRRGRIGRATCRATRRTASRRSTSAAGRTISTSRRSDRPLQGVARHRRQVRQAHGQGRDGSEAIVIADKDTPYRLLVEVLFTSARPSSPSST